MGGPRPGAEPIMEVLFILSGEPEDVPDAEGSMSSSVDTVTDAFPEDTRFMDGDDISPEPHIHVTLAGNQVSGEELREIMDIYNRRVGGTVRAEDFIVVAK